MKKSVQCKETFFSVTDTKIKENLYINTQINISSKDKYVRFSSRITMEEIIFIRITCINSQKMLFEVSRYF